MHKSTFAIVKVIDNNLGNYHVWQIHNSSKFGFGNFISERTLSESFQLSVIAISELIIFYNNNILEEYATFRKYSLT